MELNKSISKRYPGIQPFTTQESAIFFGREADATAFVDLISIRQLTVLYSKSGYGKSSLINAGVIPKLKEKKFWFYFNIRFNNFSHNPEVVNVAPFERVKQKLSEGIVPKKGNILDNLVPGVDSLWYWMKQNQAQKGDFNFIFLFDQFEELFTYPQEQITRFSEQLSELLYITIPIAYKTKTIKLDEENSISDEDYDFINQKPSIKVVLSIRSDRMSYLNKLKDKHPFILENCYELNALNREDAKKAIQEPARLPQSFGFATPYFNYTDKTIEAIIKAVTIGKEDKIDTPTLQMVCNYVESELVASQGYTTISENNLPGSEDIFEFCYKAILGQLSEAERIDAQRLIEDDLIVDGRRLSLQKEFITVKRKISPSLLDKLEESSILRKEKDTSDRMQYEIGHDALIGAIDKIADKRRAEEKDKELVDTQERANKLADLNRKVIMYLVLAIIGVILCAYSTHRANEEVRNTNKALAEKDQALKEKNVEEEKRKKEEAKSKAKDLLHRAEEFMNSQGEDYQLYALKRCEQARNIMSLYKEDSLYKATDSFYKSTYSLCKAKKGMP